MTKEEFWKKIQITKDEKRKSEFYLKYRGIDSHEEVRSFLSSVSKSECVKYSAIATAFRYDKRIRRIVYKYIGLLEEIIRSFISNNYNGIICELNKKKITKEKTLYECLCELSFGELVKIFLNDKKIDINGCFIDYVKPEKELRQGLEAVITLRNEICHNRFILNGKGLKKCNDGDKQNFLRNNIINLRDLLPKAFKKDFNKEINEAKLERKKNTMNQVEWNLPKEIIISDLS